MEECLLPSEEWTLSSAWWNPNTRGKIHGNWICKQSLATFECLKCDKAKMLLLVSTLILQAQIQAVCEFAPFITKAGMWDSIPQFGFMVLIMLLRAVAASSSWGAGSMARSITGLFLWKLYVFLWCSLSQISWVSIAASNVTVGRCCFWGEEKVRAFLGRTEQQLAVFKDLCWVNVSPGSHKVTFCMLGAVQCAGGNETILKIALWLIWCSGFVSAFSLL